MRTNITLVLIFAAIAVTACLSGENEPTLVAEGEPELIAAEGADSEIVDEGDTRPDGETGAASIVNVTVDLPPGTDLEGNAIITLEDISLSDTESVEIASVELPIAELTARENQVELFLPLPLDGAIDVNAAVHLDIDENGSFSPGDWISPGLAIVTPETASNMVIEVVPI